uniref:Integrase catalytic domain-containing protein n=1 Tax=Latimeria chalumnae TaxID=7897 RepID=H3B5R0_LATCH
VVKLKHSTSEEVYRKLKPIFYKYEIPTTVRTDNGPQLIGKDFVNFKEEFGFKHITSYPKYPLSNGLAECGVKTVKRLLKKAIHFGEDPQIGLLNYRATALEGGASPEELLFGRQIRTKLPQLELKQFHNDRKLHKKCRGKKDKRKTMIKIQKKLKTLKIADHVRIWNEATWEDDAKVLRLVSKRPYEVKMQKGLLLRRNGRHLLKVPKQT